MNRFNNESGETMAETIVSILISGLALLLLANVIGTSVNLVRTSRERMELYYEAESNMIVPATGPDSGVVKLTINAFSYPPEGISVNIYTIKIKDTDIAYYERQP